MISTRPAKPRCSRVYSSTIRFRCFALTLRQIHGKVEHRCETDLGFVVDPRKMMLWGQDSEYPFFLPVFGGQSANCSFRWSINPPIRRQDHMGRTCSRNRRQSFRVNSEMAPQGSISSSDMSVLEAHLVIIASLNTRHNIDLSRKQIPFVP